MPNTESRTPYKSYELPHGYSLSKFYEFSPYLLCLNGEICTEKGPMGNSWNALVGEEGTTGQVAAFCCTMNNRPATLEAAPVDGTLDGKEVTRRIVRSIWDNKLTVDYTNKPQLSVSLEEAQLRQNLAGLMHIVSEVAPPIISAALAGAAHGWREIEPSADLREIRNKDERVNLKPNEEWPPRRYHNAKEAVRWYMSYVEKHCYPEKTSALEYLATHGDPYVVLENIIDDGMRYAQEDNRKEVIEECAQFLEKEAAENRIRNPNNGKAEHLSVIYEHKANCLRALPSAPQSAGGE